MLIRNLSPGLFLTKLQNCSLLLLSHPGSGFIAELTPCKGHGWGRPCPAARPGSPTELPWLSPDEDLPLKL